MASEAEINAALKAIDEILESEEPGGNRDLAIAALDAAEKARDARPFKKYSLVRPNRAARDKEILKECLSGLVIEEPNDDGQVQVFWSELGNFSYVATEWLDEIRAAPAAT